MKQIFKIAILIIAACFFISCSVKKRKTVSNTETKTEVNTGLLTHSEEQGTTTIDTAINAEGIITRSESELEIERIISGEDLINETEAYTTRTRYDKNTKRINTSTEPKQGFKIPVKAHKKYTKKVLTKGKQTTRSSTEIDSFNKQVDKQTHSISVFIILICAAGSCVVLFLAFYKSKK